MGKKAVRARSVQTTNMKALFSRSALYCSVGASMVRKERFWMEGSRFVWVNTCFDVKYIFLKGAQ